MKHRILQREVILKTSQVVVYVTGQQYIWNCGKPCLHGQDMRSQSEGNVPEEIWDS